MLKGFKLNKKLENQYGEFEMNSTDLKRNRWCKLCAHNAPINKEKINNIIKINNLIMLDDYINSSTIYKFKCNNEHTFFLPVLGII